MNDYFKTNKPQVINFDKILSDLEPLSKGAKVHFMWKFIQTFTPDMCRTITRYLYQRLTILNSGNNDIPNRSGSSKPHVST